MLKEAVEDLEEDSQASSTRLTVQPACKYLF
jgi:hypothetical protein